MSVHINNTVIINVIEQLEKQKPYYLKFSDYYRGNHKILTDYKMQDSRSNMKVVFNYPRKFVDNTIGYLLGRDINYTFTGELKENEKSPISLINKELGHWVQSHDIELLRQTEIYGEAYEVNYIDTNGDFKATVKNPTNMKVITDGSIENNVILAITLYNKPLIEKQFVDVFIPKENKIITYELKNYKNLIFIEEKHNIIDEPVIVSIANQEKLCGFYDIITLIDAYNNINSDLINEISDNRNAYLTISGAKITDEDAKKMKSAGILQFPDKVKVDWLIKEINDTFVQNELKLLEDKMYDLSDQVNFNDTSMGSNTSSLALRNKLLNLDNRVSIKEALFEVVISKRLKNFFNYVSIEKNIKYDYKEISIEFTRNIPTDLSSTADVVLKLKDLVSDETLLAQIPFVKNPEMELEKKKKEIADNVANNIELEDILIKANLNDYIKEDLNEEKQ